MHGGNTHSIYPTAHSPTWIPQAGRETGKHSQRIPCRLTVESRTRDIGISGHTEINPTGRQLNSHTYRTTGICNLQPLSIARFAASGNPDRRTVRKNDR